MTIKMKTRQEGVTLIEVILAIAILGIIIIAILNLFGFSTTTIFSAGNKTKAVANLQYIAEELNIEANSGTGFASVAEVESAIDLIKNSNMTYTVSGTLTPTTGFNVVIVETYSNNKFSAEIKIFLLEGGL